MKKHFILIAFIWAISLAQGQSLDSIAHLQVGNVNDSIAMELENLMQLNDSNVMLHVSYYGHDNYSAWGVGHKYFKISRHGATVLDTLYNEDNDTHCFMFTRHPQSGEMLRIGIMHDSISQESILQIVPFNDDLIIDISREIRVHVSDTNAWCLAKSYVVNSYGELALHYTTGTNQIIHHFALFDLEGTLKHEYSFAEEMENLEAMIDLGVYSESPLEYYYYGTALVSNEESLVCHVLDSLFQPKDTLVIHKTFGNQLNYGFGWHETLLPDGDDLLLSARYTKGDIHYGENGVCVVRYDKQTLAIKNEVFFKSIPELNYPYIVTGACPIRLAKTNDGGYYFTYTTQNPMIYDGGQIAVVKMDADFNIQWQRFCLEPEGYGRDGCVFEVLFDSGVAVSGVIYNHNELFFLILNDEGNSGALESNAFLRPYMYYPNPAQDQLHLQYSPDVKPKQVELYDLQGRLVRLQSQNLESVEMQGLTAGQYLMKVTLEDGKVFTDKVIKE